MRVQGDTLPAHGRAAVRVSFVAQRVLVAVWLCLQAGCGLLAKRLQLPSPNRRSNVYWTRCACVAAALTQVALVFGCGASSEVACEPASVVACECCIAATCTPGERLCTSSGSFGECVCGGSEDAGAADASSSTDGSVDAEPPTDNGPPDAGLPVVTLCADCTGAVVCPEHSACTPIGVDGEFGTFCLPLRYGISDRCPRRFISAPNPDTEATVVCFPDFVCCIDEDQDEYGVGLQCRGPDCDDGDNIVSPGFAERCDGVDTNCNGEIDEGCDASP